MRINFCQEVAPSISAASYRDLLIPIIPEIRIRDVLPYHIQNRIKEMVRLVAHLSDMMLAVCATHPSFRSVVITGPY